MENIILFEIREPGGKVYRIFENGNIEGFDKDSWVTNHYYAILRQQLAKREEGMRERLKTLAEFNQEKMEEYSTHKDTWRNGIKCPECERELWDIEPHKTLATIPPQKNVYCPSCGYRGYRLF